MKNFIKNETGAVTVDWVVLTAALVGLGFAVIASVSSGVQDTSGDIKTALEKDDIITSSFPSSDTSSQSQPPIPASTGFF